MDVKLRRLVRDLNNSDDDLRVLSAMTIMKLEISEQESRHEVMNELIKSTQDENVAVRFFARKAIDKIRNVDKLLKLGEVNKIPIDDRLASTDFRNRLGAVMEIKENKLSEYKQKLIDMLSTEEHAFVKAGIISCIKLFLTKEEAEILSPFLSDSDNRVRSNTIEAIEYIKAENAIPALFSALSDPDNRIRAVAAKALQSFGEEKVFVELKKMLESPEEWMKGSAIYALSHIQAGEAIKMLVKTAKNASNIDTKIKAIIALANYNDSYSYGFLRNLEASGEGVIGETAVKALKLYEEKFGEVAPETTVVEVENNSGDVENLSSEVKSEVKNEDFASSVTRFFRRGKDEAIEFSKKTALNFSITDTKKELEEHLKSIGNMAFDMYKAGELDLRDMISTGNEIMKMNFFVQKYTEQEAKQAEQDSGGFLAQIKKFFTSSSSDTPNNTENIKKFSKRRDDLIMKLGKMAVKKYEEGDFTPKTMEQAYSTYKHLERKLEDQQKLLAPKNNEAQA